MGPCMEQTPAWKFSLKQDRLIEAFYVYLQGKEREERGRGRKGEREGEREREKDRGRQREGERAKVTLFNLPGV